ncbi:MAG: Na/Pi cotransporter family protein [Bacteroidetes bacterium]|nr:MAG: Na/Pi cotransporter family protein [Bacteroidota bacterium]
MVNPRFPRTLFTSPPASSGDLGVAGTDEHGHLGRWQLFGRVAMLLAILYLFLLGLYLMTGGFRLLGEDFARELVAVTTNPFIGLFIGLLATAVIQSSSATTTMIVLLVAAEKITLLEAVPMVMGANVGTSITSTIVSLGHIMNREEYQRAVAAASLHDFFNIISVAVVFGLEATTHALTDLSLYLSGLIETRPGEDFGGVLFFVKDSAQAVIRLTGKRAALIIPLGLAALFVALQLLTRLLRGLVIGRIEQNLNRYVFNRPSVALLTGVFATAAVQSSSITTSLMVPLVATDKIPLKKAFPFLMGANIGTTSTALLAAIVMEGPAAGAAMAVAFTHILFNLAGVLILYPIRPIRQLPIRMAEELGELTLKNRVYGVAYIVLVFFVLPFILIFMARA